VADLLCLKAADDVAEAFFIKREELNPEEFGLSSIRKAVGIYKGANLP
jgi:hypothetical protein